MGHFVVYSAPFSYQPSACRAVSPYQVDLENYAIYCKEGGEGYMLWLLCPVAKCLLPICLICYYLGNLSLEL